MSYLQYSTQAPFEGQNTFYVGSSVNQLFLDLLQPFSNFYNTKVYVTVDQPVFKNYNEAYEEMLKDKEHATYFDVNTFMISGWGIPYKELLDSKDSIIYPAFIGLVYEAKNFIRYEWVLDQYKWRKLASLYIAHHLDLILEISKDVKNGRSYNTIVEVVDEISEPKSKGKTQIERYEDNPFLQTVEGRLFWLEYKAIAKYNNPLWGAIL